MKKSKLSRAKRKPGFSPKRQWGTEKSISPLSILHKQPSTRAVAFSRISIVLTILFWMLYVVSVIIRQFIEGSQNNYQFVVEAFVYLLIVTFLTFSALMYLVARQGALQRFSKHIRTPRALLDRHFSAKQPSITVLIPSYSEETQVIRKTMLSAALQEYPDIQIVLLIDDDASKIRPENMARLEATRLIGKEIEQLLSKPCKHLKQALRKFEQENGKKEKCDKKAIMGIATQYFWAAQWLEDLAKKETKEDHVDVFFADQVLRALAKDLALIGEALVVSYKEDAKLSSDRISQLYRRLVWIFSAQLGFFERKRYISLSHEANKAMNLNSYIGLMGGMYREEKTSEGVILTKVLDPNKADLIARDSEFVLTLDADSILLREYCSRLVYLLQQPDNADVAVTQTPYSSFRGAPSRIERLSGATTDIQHIIHQGLTHYEATFWVGANAIIRKEALDDIVEKEWIGGFEIKKYVQDHTVIEDTESSIDLALNGWRLVNYPERLSYSATPPDFGSLIIQRRRWANGGLLILPKLWRMLQERRKDGKRPVSKTEFLLRLNYMASIAWSNFGLVLLLVYPFIGRLLSPLVLLSAMPYFISMALDLKYCRYRYSDIVRIYGFNLILLPVNIAGTLKSLQQAITAKKTPFARTPKVKNRTASAPLYLFSPLFIVGFSAFAFFYNIERENWGNVAFAGFNAFSAGWAILSYIGIKNMIVDVWLGFVELFYVDVSAKVSPQSSAGKLDLNWQGVLYYGEENASFPNELPNEASVSKK